MTSDEERWSEAQSLLERQPTADAARRLRHGRRRFLLLVLGASLPIGALIGFAAVRLSEGTFVVGPVDVPAWQVVLGVVLACAGVVVTIVGIVGQLRANRRMSAWRSPMYALTGRQRKELVAAVRGRAEVGPDRLPLARHLASNTLQLRGTVVLYIGQALLWVGQLIAFPSWWHAVAAGAWTVLSAANVPVVVRNERQARRFLAEHPPEEHSVA